LPSGLNLGNTGLLFVLAGTTKDFRLSGKWGNVNCWINVQRQVQEIRNIFLCFVFSISQIVVQTGLIWLRVEATCRLLWKGYCSCVFL